MSDVSFESDNWENEPKDICDDEDSSFAPKEVLFQYKARSSKIKPKKSV